MLQAVNLYKSFGSRRVLRGLNLTVEPGEIVALIGVNGAGKSTLMRILSTLTKPDGGRVILNGIPVGKDPTRARQQIGVVLHAPMLYGSLTGSENLRFYCRAYGIADADQRIERVLEEMNLAPRADDLARTYSRGMQQRLSIARAFLHDPQILLLDEPLTGLDDDSILRLHTSLKSAAEQGKTILFATHDLEHACALAARVVVLHQGIIMGSRSAAHLTPEELRQYFRQATTSESAEIAEGMSA